MKHLHEKKVGWATQDDHDSWTVLINKDYECLAHCIYHVTS